jgi:uncharacterized protein
MTKRNANSQKNSYILRWFKFFFRYTEFVHRRPNITLSVITLTFLLAFVSCATYNDKVRQYHTYLSTGNFAAAEKQLRINRFLKHNRNRLLYCLEAGKVQHLLHQYDSSNFYLNQADVLLDENNRLMNVAAGVLINSAQTTYTAEDFERVLIHYYKALNYYYQELIDDAIVEAKRMTMRLQELNDKQGNSKKVYKNDAFAHWFIGVLYEVNKDYNNAFIAYRNAAEVYADNNNTYYGVELPAQLKTDVLRTAYLNGFNEDLLYYEMAWNLRYTPDKNPQKELLILWENGLAPVKKENNLFFSLMKDRLGYFSFVSSDGSLSIPFTLPSEITKKDMDSTSFSLLRIAFPAYQEQAPVYLAADILSDSATYTLAPAENINAIAFDVLHDRFMKETTLALSRLAIKQVLAHRLKKDGQDEMSALMGIASFVLEKADTRNWQSLPHSIFFVRIPLKENDKEVKLCLKNQYTADTLRIPLPSTQKRLQLLNVCNYSSAIKN